MRSTLPALLAAALLASCMGPTYPDVQVGEPIPDFRLPELGGGEVASASYRGGPVVLNFWATWCKPCVHEIPTLKAIEDGALARVVSIAIDEGGEEAVRGFVEEHDIGYTVLLGDKEIFQRFNGWAIPYTLVLDSSLKIVSLHRGVVSLRSLERDLRRASPAASSG